MKLTTVVLALTYLLLPLVAAHPIDATKRVTEYDPEADAKERNGALPPGTDQKDGLALNATTFPKSVADALTGLLSPPNVREATAAELEDHIFYAKLSAAAYCRTVIPLGLFNCKHCDKSLKLVKTFKTLLADTNAMVLRGDQQKTIYVVFRGTNSINSFVVDAIFTPVDYPIAKGTKVHKGFLESYNEVRDKLVKVIQEQADNYPDYKVAVTGHSLGGSQALLCALDLFNLNSTRFGVDKLLLYTQGQPRTGDPNFAKYVVSTKIPFKRIVSKRDLIPHIPTPPMFLHAGEEFWITGDDKDTVKVCPEGIETPYCANSIAPFTSLLDHLSYFDINMGLCL